MPLSAWVNTLKWWMSVGFLNENHISFPSLCMCVCNVNAFELSDIMNKIKVSDAELNSMEYQNSGCVFVRLMSLMFVLFLSKILLASVLIDCMNELWISNIVKNREHAYRITKSRCINFSKHLRWIAMSSIIVWDEMDTPDSYSVETNQFANENRSLTKWNRV